MGLLDRLHETGVLSRRVRVLSRRLAPLVPSTASLLDVGCGDGQIAAAIAESRKDISVCGVDVLVREKTWLPVRVFDGCRLPYDDNAFDAVMFVDVLHHTEDPMVLLREARRVARKAVILKDHTRNGLLASATLRFMDRVGNCRYGVALPYNYWSRSQWHEAFSRIGLSVDCWEWRIGLYPIPTNWLFGRHLHFIARLTP